MTKDSELDALIELASTEAGRVQARERLFRILKEDSTNPRARVLLARTFYDDGLLEFSIRELMEAKKYSESPTLTRLLDAFGDRARQLGYSQSRQASKLKAATRDDAVAEIAEIEVELDFDSAMDKLK